MGKNLHYVYDVTIPFCGALKSLSGEYKFKSSHIKKNHFFGFILIFLHKIASLSCISIKNHYFYLFSYSKNHFVCLLSIVLKRSLYYCFFNHSTNTHYFWFSTTVSSLLINSSPCISLIIHMCIDSQTRERFTLLQILVGCLVAPLARFIPHLYHYENFTSYRHVFLNYSYH